MLLLLLFHSLRIIFRFYQNHVNQGRSSHLAPLLPPPQNVFTAGKSHSNSTENRKNNANRKKKKKVE